MHEKELAFLRWALVPLTDGLISGYLRSERGIYSVYSDIPYRKEGQ